MSQDLSERVKKALLSATYELCGFPPISKFPSATQAFLPASIQAVAMSGLRTSDEYADMDTYKAALATFNLNFFNVADPMPNLADVFWSGGANSRSANLKTFLQWVDTGAQENKQYKDQYEIDKRDYGKALDTRIADGNAAYDIWFAKNPNASDKQFNTWLYTTYPGAAKIKADDQEVSKKKSAFDNISKLRYGPLGAVRSDWLAKQERAEQGVMDIGYTMATTNGFKPLYDLPRSEYENWYSNAMSSTAKNTPADPNWAVTKQLQTSSGTQYNFNEYGFNSSDINTNVFIADPFFFWAKGEVKTTKEKWSAYESNNVQNATVKLCSWSTPKVFQVSPGGWWTSDPTSTFPKYDPGAPGNMKGFVYPYVAQVAVTYGIGFEFQFDKASFDSVYQHVYSSTEKRVVGIFDWIFSLEGSYTESETIVTDNKSVFFDRSSNTVRISPEHDTIPVMLGVVVNKGPQSQQLALAATPSSYDTISHQRITSFLDTLSLAITPFSLGSRLELSELMSSLLDQETTTVSPWTIAKMIDRIAAMKRTESEDDSNEIHISQTTEQVTTVVTVRSSNHSSSSSREKSKAQQETAGLATAALNLIPFLKSESAGGNAGQLLATGLASIFGIHTSPRPSEAGALNTKTFVPTTFSHGGALYYHRGSGNHLEEWWDPNLPWTTPDTFLFGSIDITFNIVRGRPGPMRSIELQYIRRDGTVLTETYQTAGGNTVWKENGTKLGFIRAIPLGSLGNPFNKIRLTAFRDSGAETVSIPYEMSITV